MANTTKKTTSAPKKTVGQKIDKKIEAVAKIDDIIIEKANEEVTSLYLKRWQVLVGSAVITAVFLAIIL